MASSDDSLPKICKKASTHRTLTFTIILSISIPFLLITIVFNLFYFPFGTVTDNLIVEKLHEPNENMRERWKKIEELLINKDLKIIVAINTLHRDLVKEEGELTVLLQQRASTLIGATSVVFAIIIAIFANVLKNTYNFLAKREKLLICFFQSFVIIVFTWSIFWTWKGFRIREDFAAYNVNDLFELMAEKDLVENDFYISDIKDFYISDILEHYQIYLINRSVNFSTAGSLRLGSLNLALGLIAFSIICVFLVIRATLLSLNTQEIIYEKES